MSKCPKCNGKGIVDNDLANPVIQMILCDLCKGKGMVIKEQPTDAKPTTCEWKLMSKYPLSEWIWYHPQCCGDSRRLYESVKSNGYKFCPFCGGEILEVE